MAKKLSIVTNGNKGGLPVQNQGLKLSKIIAIEKIEEHEKFKELYSIDEDLLERIVEDMKQNKFDASQPVHIWLCKENDIEHFYLIDGYTRIKAAKIAGLQTVPYFEHNFENFEEAHRYALHLQVDRRNLESSDLLKNIEVLMGSDYIQNMKGNKNAAVGEMLGVSEKTVERANFVKKNASEEQIAEIEAGEATINSTYDDLKGKKKKKEKESEEETSDEEISEALEDSDGEPRSVTVKSRDMSVQYNAPEETEMDKRLIECHQEGFIEGFEQAANYVLMLVTHGVSNAYIYKNIFCSKTKHNYKGLSLMIGNDPASDYDYNEFRKELLSNPKLNDLNPLPIKEYEKNPDEEEYDGPDLPFEEPAPSEKEEESKSKKSKITDLNKIENSDSAFDVF